MRLVSTIAKTVYFAEKNNTYVSYTAASIQSCECFRPRVRILPSFVYIVRYIGVNGDVGWNKRLQEKISFIYFRFCCRVVRLTLDDTKMFSFPWSFTKRHASSTEERLRGGGRIY